MQHTSHASRFMRIYRPWQKIPYHREYEDVLAEHSHRLWPETMPTCFQAVPISSLTDDSVTQEEIFKKCYPKASMEPACFKIIDPIASEATAQAAVLEKEPRSKELVEPRSKELVEGRSKELDEPKGKELERKSKTLVDLYDVIKPFGSIMSEYKETKQSPADPIIKLHQKIPTKLHNDITRSNMRLKKLHPYNFKPADTTMRCDPIRGRVKPADPSRKMYNDGTIIPVKPAHLKSNLLKPATMPTNDAIRGKVRPADPSRKMYTHGSIVPVKPADLKSKVLKPEMMQSDPTRGKVKPVDPKMYNHGLIVPVKPTAPQSKLFKPAMMRSDPTGGKVKPVDPKIYNHVFIVPLKPTDPQLKLLKPAMMRSDIIRGNAKPADPNMYNNELIAPVKSATDMKSKPLKSAMMPSDQIRGNVKPADPTRKLYNNGVIVPVKPADSLPKQGTAKQVEKLHPYNFKPTDAIRSDPIRGKVKPADQTKKLYNRGMIVPVKPAISRPQVHIDQAKIADLRLKLHKYKAKHSKPVDASLKHITVPRLQLYNSTSTSTSTINSAGPRLDRKRKYEPITTSPHDHIVKKRI